MRSGHTWHVYSVSYSPDGRYIASGSWDNTIRIWSADMSDNHIKDANTVSRFMTITLLPGSEWLFWQSGYPFYNSSLQGDEYAAVRFEKMLYPVYPLEYYRDKLKRPDLFSPASLEQISIRTRTVKLWWDRFENKGQWIRGSIFIILIPLISFVFLHVRRSDPLVISGQFFKKLGLNGQEGIKRES